jgi:hypothetical protein
MAKIIPPRDTTNPPVSSELCGQYKTFFGGPFDALVSSLAKNCSRIVRQATRD